MIDRVLILGALTACGGDDDKRRNKDDTGAARTDTDTDTDTDSLPTDWPPTGDCGGTAPTFESIEARNAGIVPFGPGTLPALALDMLLHDDDGDLHAMTYVIGLDTVIDGAVTQPEASLEGYKIVDGAKPCGATDVNLTIHLLVDGEGIAWNTPYEIAVALSDAGGSAAPPRILVATTPNEDGSDGTAVR